MKFLLDESADYPLAAYLRSLGHDVTAIAHDYPHALRDEEVLAIAVREERILITNDLDFGELIMRRQHPHRGIILFRLGDESLTVKQQRLDDVLTHHDRDLVDFIVIADHGVRVRRTQSST